MQIGALWQRNGENKSIKISDQYFLLLIFIIEITRETIKQNPNPKHHC